MRKRFLAAGLVFCWLLAGGPTFAETEALSAEDWGRIGRQRQLYFVLGKMESYADRGVVFTLTVRELIALMDKRLRERPSSAGVSMDDVFRQSVVEGQAVPQELLEKMKNHPKEW